METRAGLEKEFALIYRRNSAQKNHLPRNCYHTTFFWGIEPKKLHFPDRLCARVAPAFKEMRNLTEYVLAIVKGLEEFEARSFTVVGRKSITIENGGQGMAEKRKPKTEAAKRKVQFEFSAPEAREVSLAGDFNDWDVSANPMKKDKKGTWKVNLSLNPGIYEYRIIVDGNWTNDPSCSNCVPNEFGSRNCARVVE